MRRGTARAGAVALCLALCLVEDASALSAATPPRVLAIGEALYDSLPDGLYLGGAPLNVAVHAAELGATAAYVSAVGDDQLGRDAKRRLASRGVDVSLVQTHNNELETGFVTCIIDADGDASYEIAHPSAWDAISADPALLAAARSFDACVHGSLALRGAESAATIRALAAETPKRVFDINLRPLPEGVDARDLVEPLLGGCWVVKMNEDEMAMVQEWWGQDAAAPLSEALRRLNDRISAEFLVVTRAEAGAALVTADGTVHEAQGVVVDVADTVGAGDSFTARLVCSLLAGNEPAEALAGAVALGSWVATQAGATPAHDADAIAALGS